MIQVYGRGKSGDLVRPLGSIAVTIQRPDDAEQLWRLLDKALKSR